MGGAGCRAAPVVLAVAVVCSACVASPPEPSGPPGRSTPSLASTSPTSTTPAAILPSRSVVPPAPAPTVSASSSAPAPPGSARSALAALPVKGRAPRTGYTRAQFGQAWSDTDRNGCDTRNDILRRDLTDVVLKPGTRGCVVLSGSLVDPYTGETVMFSRGVGSSRDVQIDHVVALSDAWQKGAQQLSAARREQFANDALELLAVDGAVNAAKGDSDAASWLPPLRGSRCAFVARQIAVKRAYALWVTVAERDAMARVLGSCPAQPLPSR